MRLLRTGFGINASLARYQEASLICPWTGRPWADLSWHPLYRGKVQIIVNGEESRVDVDTAIGMVRTHQHNARHQAQVRYQQHRARMWRERQAEAPGPRSLWCEGKRSRRDPHPAAWDVSAFPWLESAR